jgi:anti-sigma factor RsiW
MNHPDCDRYRDLLPDLVSGTLDPGRREDVDAHLGACQECRGESGLLEALLRARPEPPRDLELRIQARVREEFGRAEGRNAPQRWAGSRRPRGGLILPFFGSRYAIPASALPAAAVVILALGTAVLWNPRGPNMEQESIQVVSADEPLPEAYLWDDGIVAGALVFDGLSDEDLEALLAELEEGA